MKALYIGLIAALLGSVAGADDFDSCKACHGQSGEGNSALSAPAIAGNLSPYLLRQLRAFKTQSRGGDNDTANAQTMSAAVVALSDEQLIAAAEHFSSLSPAELATSDATHRQASGYYQALCGSCHGPNGEGNTHLSAPRIAGLSNAYLTQQIRSFQSGARQQIDEPYARQMQRMVNEVDDDMMERIIRHIGTLNGEAYLESH